ncbi:MAG: 16S rRNA (cytidine(1402)-2'-O)-methyltransferase [Gallionellales bacterium 35-53-114]|nr:MAG: 16S rRNA (cytidine(1402)-2'-O)-methyltransferase [Gallionellales bacterium 35-53-114]OYZ62319.1 MAG: 16S rRNA (cytidine(1402)-2'-O)-methyltransferase [Gallionellales bacterium 24-53-125]HQS59533.1 16S rRNA (cytidine(1402)-2'-O)-methyltransferase [Gallionellaceae bacterium]HQS75564.1 16S rRNA (cytidine(1402)-2'-O)-methyltransferase [Gallionellaceae bacterium]
MHSSQKQKLECALYVVATPIGNMRDITLRALDVLSGADTIAAEDTRNSAHLLGAHGISGKRLLALHQHNERGAADKVINLLAQGEAVALITDAGTPAVSDPGALVVESVRAAGYRVIPIPGANAAVAALSAAGLATPHFLFYGFLPNKSAARCKELHSLLEHPYTLVFYEAPHRILECVEDLLGVLGGEREIVLAREITKLFENIHRCRLGDAMAWLNSDPNNLRGEFVLLVSAAPKRTEGLSAETEQVLGILLRDLPLKQAVQLAVQITGVARNELYQRALELKQLE